MKSKITYKYQDKLNELVSLYQQVPTTQLVMNSMVRFDDLYQVRHRPMDPLWWLDVFGLRASAKIKRAQKYYTQKNLIQTVAGKYGKSLVITDKGQKVYFETYPLAKLREIPWDGKWTLVSYDFPSDKNNNNLRNQLRYQLKKYGFGKLQYSMMVSPLPLAKPIQDFIEGNGLNQQVIVMTSQRVLGLTDIEISERAFNLAELYELYDDLNENFAIAKGHENRNELGRWQKYFLAVDNIDPQLPGELLPDGWSGYASRDNFKSSSSWFRVGGMD